MMMIDAYDVLKLPLEAEEEEVKKAYKRLSLLHHPDKVQALGLNAQDAGEKFNEIKEARDILTDPERRKIYDTFGIDLGEERPEMEVWTIGLGTLLSPMGGFALKTAIVRLAIWIIAWKWIGIILLLIGIVTALLYAVNFKYKGMEIRDPEALPILVNVGLVEAVLIVYWIWPLLADGVCVFYLASEVVGIPILFDSWKIGVGSGVVSLVLARLFRGWWMWILGLEVVLAIIMLAALTVAAGIMRLWIDNVQAQHGDKLKSWRKEMRRQRQELQDEVAKLKEKLEQAKPSR